MLKKLLIGGMAGLLFSFFNPLFIVSAESHSLGSQETDKVEHERKNIENVIVMIGDGMGMG